MVYIAYYTHLILKICNYGQKQHICRKDSNFCHPTQNRILGALKTGENVVLCKTPEKRCLYQCLPFSQSLGERQANIYCEDLGQKGLTTMYQLLGFLNATKEKVPTPRCHVSQPSSQWANFTGKKEPRKLLGIFSLLPL